MTERCNSFLIIDVEWNTSKPTRMLSLCHVIHNTIVSNSIQFLFRFYFCQTKINFT